jgi:hypothetical protein
MAQQFAAMDGGLTDPTEFAPRFCIKAIDGTTHGLSFLAASTSSTRASASGTGCGCGSFGPTVTRWKKTAKTPRNAMNNPAGFASHFQTV